MFAAWAAASVLALGPGLDALHGEALGRAERQVLPAPRHLGAMADVWLLPLTSLQQAGGGIELFDPLALSAYGFARHQMAFALNGLAIGDPARPGEALFDVPQDAWETLRFVALWAPRPQFDAASSAGDGHPALQLRAAYGGPLPNAPWTPVGWFDREPGFAWGAPRARRHLVAAPELGVTLAGRTPLGPVRVVGEGLWHSHRYLTLDGSDDARRGTVLLDAALGPTSAPWQLTLGWQGRARTHAGAQWRFDATRTQRQRAQAGVLQLRRGWEVAPGAHLLLALGLSGRWDDARSPQPARLSRDLLDDWLLQARPDAGERSLRLRLDARATLSVGALCATLSAGGAGWQATPAWLADGGQLESIRVGGAPAYARAWAAPGSAHEWLRGGRAELALRPRWGDGEAELLVALDVAAAGADARSFAAASPALGAAWRQAALGGEVYALVRREPEALTGTVAAFLDPARPASQRYAWADPDGDGVAAAAEFGAPRGVGGGPTHTLAPGLRRPSSNQLAVGYRSAQLGPFRLVLQGVARALLDRLTVRLQDVAGVTPVPFHDPGGDGRGEARAPGGGQDLTVYAQSPASLAAARYQLTNDPATAYYLGVEADLMAQASAHWFFSFGGAAYLSPGAAPFGSFADANDPGDLAETSPNAGLHAFGRYDQDRSFTLKLLAGVLPLPGASLALAARYRDGEPFTRMLVVPELPQGPEVVMAVPRGEVRHTFHMTWDARARYAWRAGPVCGAVLLDVYNLLASGTELLEDPRTGASFRRALEAVPGRSGWLGLELGMRGR